MRSIAASMDSPASAQTTIRSMKSGKPMRCATTRCATHRRRYSVGRKQPTMASPPHQVAVVSAGFGAISKGRKMKQAMPKRGAKPSRAAK